MKNWIDSPPVWLLLALTVAWGQSQYLSAGLTFGGAWADFAGGLSVGAGLLLITLAIYEMTRQHTTAIPHREAAHLVTTGIFSRSRNPIYLGDALILTGLILTWNAVISLPLIPIFVWWIERHFILPEEDGLGRKFRADFTRYCEKTRRWV